ncbi:hypothetical protein GGR16_005093 [Chelatococcus caeni]|uniref:Uncharacterized protein n=1 Tax=Chelatococcus caeni TaxID=1348468 RepID=A0A840C2E4_9HYPH|nr:hypothetical protein [Chelatococcus caeni]MBB4020031.1 hypothetical protein [Chelatococcus caeni]
MSQYLVNSEKAANTLTMLRVEAGLKARFGDPKRFPSVAHELTSLHVRVRANAESVVALAKDATRTEVAKHAAAKELAQRTIKAIGDTAEALKARAAILQSDGQAKADHFFAPQPGYSHIESEVRTWLREQVKSETGLGKVLSLAKEDQILASVIYHSPHYLTGLAPDLQAKLRLDMTEHFVPEAFALVNEGVEIEAVASRYDKTTREINAAFYTPAIADQANSRVELGAA